MRKVERIGVSVEPELLSEFDRLIKQKGFANRSQAIGDLIRESIAQEQLKNPASEAVAGIFLVYDHHTTGLNSKLNEMQHSHLIHVIASTHIHLDHHNCLEIIILKGKSGQIQKPADSLASTKGVKISRSNLMTVDMEKCH
jgi:CopG family transcriptional regulator, nickel-responsive regulator